jgi:hypothetical protein
VFDPARTVRQQLEEWLQAEPERKIDNKILAMPSTALLEKRIDLPGLLDAAKERLRRQKLAELDRPQAPPSVSG